ncbi:hypothetical protein FOZ62_021758, partial [Perkinsus olseni]
SQPCTSSSLTCPGPSIPPSVASWSTVSPGNPASWTCSKSKICRTGRSTGSWRFSVSSPPSVVSWRDCWC